MGYVETTVFHQYDPKVLFDPLYNNASADTFKTAVHDWKKGQQDLLGDQLTRTQCKPTA